MHRGQGWRSNAALEAVKGEVWETTTCFEVNLGWLALPAVITLLVLVVLIWTIARGAVKGEVVWKSSILPLMYYRDKLEVMRYDAGAQSDPAHEREGMLDKRQLEEDSRDVKVIFRGGRNK